MTSQHIVTTVLTVVAAIAFTNTTQAQHNIFNSRISSALQRVDSIMSQPTVQQSFQHSGRRSQHSIHVHPQFVTPQLHNVINHVQQRLQTECLSCPNFVVSPPVVVHPHPIVTSPPIGPPIYNQPIHPAPVEVEVAIPAPTLPLPPQPGSRPDKGVRVLVAEAKALFQAAKYDQTRAILDAIVALVPEDSNAYQFRAATYFAMEDFDKAAADAYDAVRFGNVWNWEAITDIYDNTETYTDQLRDLEAAVKRDNESMSKHFLLAYHYLVMNHLEHGKSELEKVLTINPEENLSSQLLVAVKRQLDAAKVSSK